MEETIPRPVTTTRRMSVSFVRLQSPRWPRSFNERGSAADGLAAAEQADAHVLAGVDDLSVGLEHAVGDAHDQAAVDDPLQVDLIHHLLDVGGDLAGEFHLAD